MKMQKFPLFEEFQNKKLNEGASPAITIKAHLTEFSASIDIKHGSVKKVQIRSFELDEISAENAYSGLFLDLKPELFDIMNSNAYQHMLNLNDLHIESPYRGTEQDYINYILRELDLSEESAAQLVQKYGVEDIPLLEFVKYFPHNDFLVEIEYAGTYTSRFGSGTMLPNMQVGDLIFKEDDTREYSFQIDDYVNVYLTNKTSHSKHTIDLLLYQSTPYAPMFYANKQLIQFIDDVYINGFDDSDITQDAIEDAQIEYEMSSAEAYEMLRDEYYIAWWEYMKELYSNSN